MEEECVTDQVEEKGATLDTMLQHREVKEIRRIGLFMAIDLSSAEKVQHVVDYCKDHGVLSFWFLSCPNSFRIAPPLNISTEDLKKGALVIQKAFDSL